MKERGGQKVHGAGDGPITASLPRSTTIVFCSVYSGSTAQLSTGGKVDAAATSAAFKGVAQAEDGCPRSTG